ncbi:trigger factor [Oligella urethralis]|uniref:trigger factor n=1 Tax=Oligella urethralis TaxID=90245 RepID=UPI0027B8AA70|nr:trigger factor [Oligella urethralis]
MEVQTLEGLARQVDLVLSLDAIEAEVKQELQKVARKVKVDGFRPGKAPLAVVERSHGPSIRYDVINRRVGEEFDRVIKETDLRVAGFPEIVDSEAEKEDGKLAFTAKFEVFPTVEIPDLGTLEVTKYTSDIGEQQLEDTLAILREQRAEYKPEEGRAAQDGDRLLVDFVGKIDGEEFQGGQAEDFNFVLGRGMMLPEFEEAAKGLKAGEEKTFELNFPEDYQGQEVAGKTAEFTLKVKEVAVPELPEVDADFAKSLGQEDGDVAKLREEILANIKREGDNRLLQRTKSNVLDALVNATDFEVPTALVNNEINERINNLREEFAAQGMKDFDFSQIPTETFKPEAERRVRLGLLVAEIVEQEKLQATAEQVRARIEEFAQNYEKPEEVVAYYLSDQKQRAGLEALVLEDNMIDFILSKAKVTEEEVPFKELMGQA